MNSLKTLYFPVTDIYSVRQFPLFLLFQNVHLIQPVEKSPDLNTEQTENSFIKSEFCHVHTPCPLGEHKNRFLHLVEDIRNRKDDYASQLSYLTLAAMSKSTGSANESEREIVSAIFTPSEIRDSQDSADSRTEKLWNSRLVLAMAEILDQEEEEIARGMAVLQDDETELFQSLHGSEEPEEDSPFQELIKLEKNIGAADSRNERNRTRAWQAIFQEANINDVELLLTTSQLSANVLLEKFDKENGSAPIQLNNFELPGLISWDEKTGFESVSSFVRNNDELLNQISSVLQEIAEADSPSQDFINSTMYFELAEKWQNVLESSFPAQQYGRDTVVIYILPGFPCSRLLTETQPEQAKFVNTLLIVLE